MSIKRFVFFLLITATVSSIYFLSFGSELYNNLKILVNADGQKGHGFYVHQTGLLVTDHAISENFVELKISQSTSVTEKALVVKKLPFQGFSLLAAEATSRTLYSLGDSDSVDIGDKIHIPGSYSGKIVSKRNNFGDYHYPCFTTDLPADKNNVGKPVLNINNKIIGLYISFRNKHLLVPINRVKPLIKQHNQVKKLFSFPGEEIGDNLANKALLTKGYSIISEDNSWKNNLLPLTQYGGNPDFSFGHIKDMAFDQKNNLYVIDSVYNEIKKISLSSVLKEGGDNGWTLYPPNPSSTDLLEPRGSDITEPTTADTTTDTGIKPDDTAETKDPKDNDKAKTPPPPSHTKTVDLERPVSVTVSYAGLIFVLDHGLEEIVIFNEDLKIVHRFNYKKIAGHFNPVLIRAYGDKIYAITDTDRLYRMTFRKTSEEFVATNIKFIHDRWLTANIIDFDYNKDHFFWLDNKKKLIRVMNRKQKISKSLRLNMDTPRSLASHKDELFVLDKISGSIQVLHSDGTVKGTLKGTMDKASGSPSLIKVSSKGILAIAYNNLSHIRLYRTSGELIKVLSNHSIKDNLVSSPISITVGQDKTPVAVSENPLIHNIQSSGATDTGSIGNSLLPEDKTSLRGIVAGSAGDIFFVDTQNDRLLIKPARPNSVLLYYSGKHLGQLDQPIQLAAANEMIYILDKANHRVATVNEKGVLQKFLVVKNSLNQLVSAQDISVNKNGEIFILGENIVMRYSKDGKLLNDFFVLPGKHSYLGYAKGIACDDTGVFVADTYNDRILRYSNDGKYQGQFGKTGGKADEFFHPWDIIKHGEDLYIIDKGNHRVVRYGPPAPEPVIKKDGKKNPEKAPVNPGK